MSLIKFPGLIDIHVHLREPGATHKEDFGSGSRAAISGGFTFILDMPNNPLPTITPQRLDEKIKLSRKKSICDIGFHYGTDGKNLDTFKTAWINPDVFGLKIYCNHTTGSLLVDDNKVLEQIFIAWKSDKLILVHAEGERLEYCIKLAEIYHRRMHVCHIATYEEVEMVRLAKKKKLLITAGVTPHHLFLTQKDIKRLGNFSLVKPLLNPKQNMESLWEALNEGTIDIIESDHAPHTEAEKLSDKPPFGIPGLETTLSLLLTAVKHERLTQKKVLDLLYIFPKRIFNIPDQLNTYIEVDPEKQYSVTEDSLQTKCRWSPFVGWKLYGKVETVVLHNKTFLKYGALV